MLRSDLQTWSRIMFWIFESNVFAVGGSSQSPLLPDTERNPRTEVPDFQLFKLHYFIAISNLIVIIKVRGPWTMKQMFYKRRYCFIFIEKNKLFVMCWEQSSSTDRGGYRLSL